MKIPSGKSLVIITVLAAAGAWLIIKPPYILKQGWFLFSYYSSAAAIETYKKEKPVTEKEKILFSRIADIKKYALGPLGLTNNNNYTTYIKLDRDYINLVVSASDPLKLEARNWDFPFFGKFPYLGFFNREDANLEVELLKSQSYDVYLRKARAFSTLGILPDPVYSYFTDYSLFSLAYLIIHEQTHATLFLKDQVRFNEELATFTGHTGALSYIESRFGKNSSEHQKARSQIKTSKEIYEFFRLLYKELEKTYGGTKSKEKKLAAKTRILTRYKIIFINRFHKKLHSESLQWYKDLSWNNAFVLSFIRYGADLSLFEKLYIKEGRDIKKMLKTLSICETVEMNPKDYIRQVLLNEKL